MEGGTEINRQKVPAQKNFSSRLLFSLWFHFIYFLRCWFFFVSALASCCLLVVLLLWFLFLAPRWFSRFVFCWVFFGAIYGLGTLNSCFAYSIRKKLISKPSISCWRVFFLFCHCSVANRKKQKNVFLIHKIEAKKFLHPTRVPMMYLFILFFFVDAVLLLSRVALIKEYGFNFHL